MSTGSLSSGEAEELHRVLQQEVREQEEEFRLRKYPTAKQLRGERRKLLPLAVVARILGVATEAVGHWIAQGRLEVIVWPDGELLVHTDTLRRLLQPRPLDEEEGGYWWEE